MIGATGTPLSVRLARKLFNEQEEREGLGSPGVPQTVPAHSAPTGELLDAVATSPFAIAMRDELTTVAAQMQQMMQQHADMMQQMNAYMLRSMPAEQQQQQQTDERQHVAAAGNQTQQEPDGARHQNTAAERQRVLEAEQSDSQNGQPGARSAQQGGQPEEQAQNGDSCMPEQVAAVSARELECPISALQTLLWYEHHDPPLHREGDKRWTVNGPTMYDHIVKNRSDVTQKFEDAVAEPGPQVEAAMNAFRAAVTENQQGGRVTEHSMASLLVEGFKRCGSEAVAEDARGLVLNAVVRSKDLGALVAEVEAEGVFDREVSEADVSIADMPGFQDFDPGTSAGRMRWRQLRELFEAYFAQSAEPAENEQRQKERWQGIRLLSVSEFIPCEKKAFRRWRQAGGDITDASRIEDVKARFGPKLGPAYSRHVEAEACAGRREEMLEKKWGLFCKVMERCGKAVGPENVEKYNAAMAAAGRGFAAAESVEMVGDGKEECWEHLALGNCSYGEKNCKFSHAGVAGSNRDHAVDKQGNCRQFKKHGFCKRLDRGNCPFLHNKKGTGEPDSLSAEQHGAVIKYAEANSLDPTTVKWSSVRADGEDKWLKKAGEAASAAGGRKPVLYPVLSGRGQTAVTYKEALKYAAGAAAEDSE